MAEHQLHHDDHEDPKAQASRRAVLQAAIGMGLIGTTLSTLYIGAGLIPIEETTPESEAIAPGDILVFAQGERSGQPIAPTDLQPGQNLVIAYPMNPSTKVVKSGEANNTIIMVRLDPATLDAQTANGAANGVVAYSGVCKHLGCIVSNWDAAAQVFVCPCHVGRYDPKQGAKVVGGPPPGPIPQLPVRLEGNQIVAAGEFAFEPGKA